MMGLPRPCFLLTLTAAGSGRPHQRPPFCSGEE
jgi:hypothetical protein